MPNVEIEGVMETEKMLEILRAREFAIDKDSFEGKHVISTEQFTPEAISKVMEVARMMETLPNAEAKQILAGYTAAVLFFEPSSRTFNSFALAAQKLGMDTVLVQDMKSMSSVSKHETLRDTAKVFGAYAQVMAVRHPKKSAALEMALSSDVPVINGGSGTFEHPTQALLDYYTILKEVGVEKNLEDLHICFVGDLANGRTVHSLSKLLCKMGIGKGNGYFSFVSPEVVRLPSSIKRWLVEQGVNVYEYDQLEEVGPYADVIYMTRIQKERFVGREDEYEQACKGSKINGETLKILRSDAVIMHPLPRDGENLEISEDVDDDPRAAYFRQAANGLPVRMALLALVLGAVR